MEVISILEIPSEDLVYDLETDVGTFIAGGMKNGILVKNTDSCYVKFQINARDYPNEETFMESNFKQAKECADYCTSQFKPPIKLEFEKFMYPLMLFAKKRYAYREWTNPSKPDNEIHYKGLQLVRRDTCRYVKEELNRIFEIIMDKKSIEEANSVILPYIRESIQNLLDGKVDPNKLILSKQLKARYIVRKNNKSVEYHWKCPEIQQPHVRLAQELLAKNPSMSPKPPDRVPYLFIEKDGLKILQCDKVIHPEDYNAQVHKLDSLYYFDHQFKGPINMIFGLLIKDPEIIYKNAVQSKINQLRKQPEVTNFFKPISKEVVKKIDNFVYKSEDVEEVDSIEEDPDDLVYEIEE